MDNLRLLQAEAAALRQRIQRDRKAVSDTTLKDATSSIPPLKPIRLENRRVLEGHLSRVYALGWGEDSRNLVSASQGGRLICWDTYKAEMTHIIPMSYNWVMTCACSPSFRQVASGGMDNTCTIYGLGRPMSDACSNTVLKGHKDYLSCCKFVDEEKIITSSGDSKCFLWDIETGKPTISFEGHNSGITSVALAPDRRMFVTGCCDATAKLWDLRDKNSKQTFMGHDLDVNAVNFFPSGQAFATGSDDSSCRLFDIRSDKELATYEMDDSQCGVTSLAFSKSGRILFAGFDDYYCLAWDALKANSLGEWAGREHRVSCMDITPDGKAIATGSWDSALKIWN